MSSGGDFLSQPPLDPSSKSPPNSSSGSPADLPSSSSGELNPQQFSARRALPSDAPFIAEIAALVNIHNYSQFDRGFLLYSLTEEEYFERIQRGDLCFVLAYEGRPIGFLAAIKHQEVARRVSTEPNQHPVFEEIERCSAKMKLSSYLFVDQAAILPEYQNQGFGEQLFASLAADLQGPYFCDILEAPLRNPRVRYWMKRGFRKVAEVKEAAPERFLKAESTLSHSDQLTWGIYFLENLGWKMSRSR